MHYLATIKYTLTDSFCQSFDTEKEAKDWLDEKNNNLAYETTISVTDEKWRIVDSYCYTEAAK